MKYDVFVGVDNGNSGAVAAIGKDGKPAMLFDTPLRYRHPEARETRCTPGTKAEAQRRKKAERKETDPQGVKAIIEQVLEKFQQPIFVLERYQLVVNTKDRGGKPTNPQAPIYAAWAYGIWEGILNAYDVAYMEIDPRKWQNRIIPGARGESNKTRAIEEAERRFPDLKGHLRGPRGGPKDGRADALLIATYGRDVQKHVSLFGEVPA